MKRAGNLFPKLTTENNIKEAFYKAARRKATNEDVIAFKKNFDTNIDNLREQLLNNSYVFGDVHFFTIHDPKTRLICAPSFTERVIHHAIINVCEPIFDSFQIDGSYACQINKGNAKAIEKARQFAKNYDWFLKLDIKKYFDSINHEIALTLLARRFKDKDILRLFENMIESYHVSPGKGVPIGSLFSQHLANYYLGYFDHWIKETLRVKPYLRYMDDILLFDNNKSKLKQDLFMIDQFLSEKLQLILKENIQLNKTERGVPFLGFLIFPTFIRLNSASKLRFSAKFRKYERLYCEGIWSEKELTAHMQSLFAFANQSDSLAFRKMIIERFGVL